MEHPGFELVSTWDAGIADKRLTPLRHSASPQILFSKPQFDRGLKMRKKKVLLYFGFSM